MAYVRFVPIRYNKMKDINKIVEEFFKRRFPDKDIKFEKECGYFYEWVDRFNSGHPENYMDSESLKVFKEMTKEELI